MKEGCFKTTPKSISVRDFVVEGVKPNPLSSETFSFLPVSIILPMFDTPIKLPLTKHLKESLNNNNHHHNKRHDHQMQEVCPILRYYKIDFMQSLTESLD
jgi:hypothetical protein